MRPRLIPAGHELPADAMALLQRDALRRRVERMRLDVAADERRAPSSNPRLRAYYATRLHRRRADLADALMALVEVA